MPTQVTSSKTHVKRVLQERSERWLTEKGVLGSPGCPRGLLADSWMEIDTNLPLYAPDSITANGVVVHEKTVVGVFCNKMPNPVGHARTGPSDAWEADAKRSIIRRYGVFVVVLVTDGRVGVATGREWWRRWSLAGTDIGGHP